MQRVLGLEDDGNIGDITLKIVRAADQLTLVKEFSAARLAFLQGLPVFRHFSNGLTNRANLAEAAALSLLV
jgi:lysozyme family protein